MSSNSLVSPPNFRRVTCSRSAEDSEPSGQSNGMHLHRFVSEMRSEAGRKACYDKNLKTSAIEPKGRAEP